MNVASYDNYTLINSYFALCFIFNFAFCILPFSMTTLLQLGVHQTNSLTTHLETNSNEYVFCFGALPPERGGGGTPIYKLYRFVPL